MITNRHMLWVALTSACLSGCVPGELEDDAGLEDDDAGTAVCVPDAQAYRNEILPLITTYCSSCHAATPVNGAPFSLVTYEALLAPYGAGRVVDVLPRALANKWMPPSYAQPQPRAAERQRMIDWASCE